MIAITVLGAPASKKNSMQIITTGNRPRLIQGKRYREYAKEFERQLMPFGNRQIIGPVHVKCLYYVPDRRKRDLLNLLAATADLLEKCQIIVDDCQIVRVDGSRIAGVDRDYPRVEIAICEEPPF